MCTMQKHHWRHPASAKPDAGASMTVRHLVLSTVRVIIYTNTLSNRTMSPTNYFEKDCVNQTPQHAAGPHHLHTMN